MNQDKFEKELERQRGVIAGLIACVASEIGLHNATVLLNRLLGKENDHQ